MKNVRDTQLKKCIFVEKREFSNIMKNIFGDNTCVDCSDGICIHAGGFYISDGTLIEELSEYFDVHVTSVHVDDYDYEPVGIWICYTETE